MQLPGLSLGPDVARWPWKATRVPGVHWIPLHLGTDGPRGDGNERGASTVLIRMAPGTGYEPHLHLGAEDVLVLHGGYRDEQGAYTAGTYVRYPAGSRHAPVALGDPDRAEGPDNPACVLFAVASGGIELLRP